MNFHEVVDMVAPEQSSIDEVHLFLIENGVEDIQLHQSRDFITVSMSVEKAETLFQVSRFNFIN